MDAAVALIHSPLVGPSSWRWVADELTRAGHVVVVPSLADGAAAGSARECVAAAADQIPVFEWVHPHGLTGSYGRRPNRG